MRGLKRLKAMPTAAAILLLVLVALVLVAARPIRADSRPPVPWLRPAPLAAFEAPQAPAGDDAAIWRPTVRPADDGAPAPLRPAAGHRLHA
jgi:hypothetical protein